MLTVTNLQVSYGEIRAVEDVSLTVARGEIVSLLGANGAGKTTTLGAISGLLKTRAGRIEFNGENITNWPAERIVKLGLCQVPEGRRLFGTLTVEENLRIGAYTERQSHRALVGRTDEMCALFPRLKERRSQLAGNLSGGEQQMLAVARALMSRPKLLALDEPSLGLSPLMTRLILETVVRIAKDGVAILLVEQNAKKALRVSTRAYVLESGRTALSGASSELESNPRVQALYLGGSAAAPVTAIPAN
jgi:branched-chain amino acid transport system ATP-binding protein